MHDAHSFLVALGASFDAVPRGLVPGAERGPWTEFISERILAAATHCRWHVCAETIDVAPGEDFPTANHERKEYQFDFTLYAEKNWTWYALPDVILEHENDWNVQSFLNDFWKLLAGYAPLRVMMGYASNPSKVDELVQAITRHASESRWRYPNDVDDLVLLRCPEPGMAWPEWRVLVRLHGDHRGWLDAREVALTKNMNPKDAFANAEPLVAR